MMEERELAEVVEQQQYFEAVPAPSPEEDEGTRDMGPLYPFLISGGTNTERYYFTHIIIRAEYNINAAVAADDLKNQSYSYVYKVFKER